MPIRVKLRSVRMNESRVRRKQASPEGIAGMPVPVSQRPPPLSPAREIAALNGDPNFMTSLARGLAVIQAFTEQRRKLTIAQISDRTGIPRAAVRRCLYTLQKLGYVGSEAHAFALRPKMLALGHAYLSSTPLAVSAQPFLDRVGDAVSESCSLAILDGEEILYLARSLTSRIMSVTLNIGSRLPAYCTSIGYVLLAHLPEPELDAYLTRVQFQPFTERTITSPGKLRETLSATRQAGYAIADQEMELGIRSIAVPVADTSGTVVAGINVIVQAARVSVRQMKTQYLPHLESAARELGTLLLP
jgi:IclR family transcriptional regulator, pca regulon regulatory protein